MEDRKEDIVYTDNIEGAFASALTPDERVTANKLRKRIDLLIMPLVVLIYVINFIDRNNYAAARLQGLEADLNLSEQQYQLGLSIFFVGYLLGQVPGNMILEYFARPSWHMAGFTCAWGLVTLCTAFVKGFGGILACRLILGFVEAPLFPGIAYYLSKWYPKSELNLRMSIFFSGSFIGGAFGNLIAAGILDGLAGQRNLKAWQWLYIVEGAITVAVGMMTVFILPDFPHTWKSLTDEELRIIIKRIAVENTNDDVEEEGSMPRSKAFKMAFTDLNVYILGFMYFTITGAAGFQNFLPSLTATLGYGRIISLVLVAPPYIFMTFYSYGHGILSDRKATTINSRFWFYMYPIPLSIIGFTIFTATHNFGAKYFSIFLMMYTVCIYGTLLSWIAAAIPRPAPKRAVAYGMIVGFGNSSSIWTPFTYRGSDMQYRVALLTCIGLQATAALLGVWLRFRLAKEERLLASRVTLTPAAENVGDGEKSELEGKVEKKET